MTKILPAELARRLGVHKSTVSRQLRARPHLLDGTGRVDADEYLAAIAAPPDKDAAHAEPFELVRARARVLMAEAELAMAAAKLALIEARARRFRDALLAVPSRCVSDPAEAAACRAELDRALAPFIGGADA